MSAVPKIKAREGSRMRAAARQGGGRAGCQSEGHKSDVGMGLRAQVHALDVERAVDSNFAAATQRTRGVSTADRQSAPLPL